MDNLIKVNDLIDSKIRPTDHVKKNVREVTTAFSKKSSSIYLTGANIQEFKASKHREKDQNKNEYEKALDFRKKNSLKEE